MPLARMLSRKSKDTNSISIQTVPQPALLLGALLPLFLWESLPFCGRPVVESERSDVVERGGVRKSIL